MSRHLMALGTGTRLGRYEILEPIGAGGMGAVYRARDTQLGREVAVKVLLDEFTQDTDRVRRFEREAKALAALNHPNLLAVYDVGTEGGSTYLVSELLEGRSLRDVLASGPLSSRRAARYASQIAEGLAAAHAKGIVHRDLKPANLFITTDDRVKILDFGLARVMPASAADDAAARTTETALTAAGTVLGSAGYMAPEQVRGVAIDHRADIFGLGTVLYEMLAGRRAFHRDTVAGTLAAIVESEPPSWSGDGSIAVTRLMRVVRRCLEKNPDQRFQSARDLAHVLADESVEDSAGTGTAAARPQTWRTIAFIAGAAAITMAGLSLWSWQGRSRAPVSSDQRALAFDFSLPQGLTLVGAPVLSADGGQIAFVATSGDRQRRLYLRRLSDPEVKPLPGTDNARQPFFSPSGDRIAFFASGSLKVMNLDGGSPAVLCPAPDARGGAWGDDDSIVFAPEPTGGLSRIPARGGAPEPVTTLGIGDASHRWPVIPPGGHGVVFVAMSKDRPPAIVSIANRSSTLNRIIENATAPRYANGWLFYVNSAEAVLAAPFDTATLRPTAPGVPLPERFALGGNQTDFAYSVSEDGKLAFVPFTAPERSLAIIGPGGQSKTIPGPMRPFEDPRVSPSGERIAVTIRPKTAVGDVWIGDTSGTFLPLTRDGQSRWSVWSPSGNQIAVESIKTSSSAVLIYPTDGRDSVSPATDDAGYAYPMTWTVDNTVMIARYNIRGRAQEELKLITLPNHVERPASLPVKSLAYVRVSPDRKWLGLASPESGQWEVYVSALPGPGPLIPVSGAGSGREPVWAKSGNDLFFLRADGTVMVVTIGANGPTGAARDAGVGKFAVSPTGPGLPWWDTMPNGRFIVTQTQSDPRRPSVHVIVNRTASLRAK